MSKDVSKETSRPNQINILINHPTTNNVEILSKPLPKFVLYGSVDA